ncbi:HD domain-containing protein [Holdemania sp. Marseille-P2844]|uniref:HD domain-containing protein n=1 Tax=Holdemania sp. Marseille-P2844 TaxID=1852366 RepID=UPI0009327300|nr:HD domain-containing protein [Holdemania sp. Marseille-P2844]
MIENNEEQTELVELLRVYAQATLNTEKVQSMRGYLQHGDTTTLDHAIAVAYYSLMLDRKWNLNCDKSSLVRGALLHDYFLYDWHQPHKEYGLHGFTHPFTALRNAVQDFNLNAVERNIIARHMFPLVPIPPRYRESMIVCLADKFCSLNETFSSQRYCALVKLLSTALIFHQ